VQKISRLISGTVRKLEQCKYAGNNLPLPAYAVQIPLQARGLTVTKFFCKLQTCKLLADNRVFVIYSLLNTFYD